VLSDAMDGHDTRDLAALIEELSPQADSGKAIFIAALLDGELQRLLLTFMPTISNILAERLFEDYGPLNSLAAKIDMARALDLIDMGTYTDLRAIQVIRNTFAHPTDRLDFKSPEIERRGISLRGWRAGCDLRAPFEERASNAMAAMAMKADALIYAHVSKGE
jgi:DNA-binding MltR family transcriptional regulator